MTVKPTFLVTALVAGILWAVFVWSSQPRVYTGRIRIIVPESFSGMARVRCLGRSWVTEPELVVHLTDRGVGELRGVNPYRSLVPLDAIRVFRLGCTEPLPRWGGDHPKPTGEFWRTISGPMTIDGVEWWFLYIGTVEGWQAARREYHRTVGIQLGAK